MSCRNELVQNLSDPEEHVIQNCVWSKTRHGLEPVYYTYYHISALKTSTLLIKKNLQPRKPRTKHPNEFHRGKSSEKPNSCTLPARPSRKSNRISFFSHTHPPTRHPQQKQTYKQRFLDAFVRQTTRKTRSRWTHKSGNRTSRDARGRVVLFGSLLWCFYGFRFVMWPNGGPGGCLGTDRDEDVAFLRFRSMGVRDFVWWMLDGLSVGGGRLWRRCCCWVFMNDLRSLSSYIT